MFFVVRWSVLSFPCWFSGSFLWDERFYSRCPLIRGRFHSTKSSFCGGNSCFRWSYVGSERFFRGWSSFCGGSFCCSWSSSSTGRFCRSWRCFRGKSPPVMGDTGENFFVERFILDGSLLDILGLRVAFGKETRSTASLFKSLDLEYWTVQTYEALDISRLVHKLTRW